MELTIEAVGAIAQSYNAVTFHTATGVQAKINLALCW